MLTPELGSASKATSGILPPAGALDSRLVAGFGLVGTLPAAAVAPAGLAQPSYVPLTVKVVPPHGDHVGRIGRNIRSALRCRRWRPGR